MNVILDEEYKKDLINHFSSAIKQVQMEQLAKQSVGDGPESQHIITNDSPSGQILCSSLEMIFMHGLKERKAGYWEVVRYFCRNDVIQIIKRLKHVKTDFGRGRAWIFIALNENELEGYLQSFVMDLQHMQKYYQRYAMLCSSQVSVLQTLISGLEYVKFNLHPDVPHLDFRILNTTAPAKKIATYSGGATHVVDKNRGSVVHIDATPLTELASKGKERASSFLKDHFRRENTNEPNVAKMPMKVIADHSVRLSATAESVGGCQKCAKRNALICLCVEKDANAIPNIKQEDKTVPANGCILNESDHATDRVPFNSPQGIPERFNPFDKDVGYTGEYVILESIKKESFKRFDKHVAISDTPIEVVHKPRKKPRRKERISDSGSESSAKSEERGIAHEMIYSPMLDADDPDSMFTGTDPDMNVTNLMRFMKKMSQPRHVYLSQHEHTSDRDTSSEVGDEPNHPTSSLTGDAGIGGATGTDTYGSKTEPESSTVDGQTNVDSNEKCNTAEFPAPLSHVQEYNMCNIADHTEHHISEDQKNSALTLNSNVETATNGKESSNVTAVRTCDGETEIPTEKVSVSSSSDNATEDSHSTDMLKIRTFDNDGTPKDGELCDESEASSIYVPEIANADIAQVEEMVSDDDLGEENIYEGEVSSATPDSVMSSVQPLMADEQIPEATVSIATINARNKENGGLVDSLSSNDLTTNSHRPSLDVGVRNPNSEVTQVLTQHEQMENVCGGVDCMEKTPESHTMPEVEALGSLTINDCDHEADHGTLKHDQRSQPTDCQFNQKVLKDEALSPIFFHETFSMPDSASVPCNSEETTSANSKNDFSEDDCLDGTVSKGQDEEALHPSVVTVDNNLRLYLLIEILEDESETIIKTPHLDKMSLDACLHAMMSSNNTENIQAQHTYDRTYRLVQCLPIPASLNEFLNLFHLSTGHSEGCWAALYLLFTDCFIYFLRNGDGKSPFQVEHLVSYEDLDYISTAYCGQAMQFVFYEEKPSPTKGASANRRKLRTKMTLDTADEHLTDIVITSLSNAFVLFAKQRGVVKCPPVFHNSKDHELLLRKYVQSEGLSGEIDLYLLVHWEDPDSVAGEALANVTKEGALDCKTRSFWGSAWKPAYFVLSSGILYQYKSKETDKPDAIYDLKENKCAGCKRARSNSSTPSLEFEVIFQDETLNLRGQTDAEVTGWLQHLCLTVALKQAPDPKCPPDDRSLRSLTHDALVPCSLVISCETMLLFHEDPLTGFCRTLAKAGHDDFASVHFDRERNACEIAITNSTKWAVFFHHAKSVDTFDDHVNKFSRAPMTGSVVDQNLLSHFEEGRFLLDNRWTRPDNLLKGRHEKDEYAFI